MRRGGGRGIVEKAVVLAAAVACAGGCGGVGSDPLASSGGAAAAGSAQVTRPAPPTASGASSPDAGAGPAPECAARVVASMADQPAGWALNGSASWDPDAGSVVLVPAVAWSAGSLVYPYPVSARAFDVTFEFRMGGGTSQWGTPADGIAFFMTTDGSHALGAYGGGLGVAGLHGYGVELDTYADTGCGDGSDSSDNHVAIDTLDPVPCGSGGQYDPSVPTMLRQSTELPIRLDDGAWHSCALHFADGVASVRLDGVPVIERYAIAGFSTATPYTFGIAAATGGDTDRHEVRNVTMCFDPA